jgi:murein L,D-transpeptidase YafK
MELKMKKQASLTHSTPISCLGLPGLMVAVILAAACTHAPSDMPVDTPAPKYEATPEAPAPTLKTETQQPAIAEQGLSILVSKAERTLTVYRDGEMIHRYRVGLGFRPQGPKRWEGDGRTPEGRYSIAMKNPRSRYYLSMALNYPTPDDASRGYKEGRINWEEYRAIKLAYNDGKAPPWNTRLGGQIFIHGRGATQDWTRGCIALDDADMRELYSLVDVGTPVTIVP